MEHNTPDSLPQEESSGGHNYIDQILMLATMLVPYVIRMENAHGDGMRPRERGWCYLVFRAPGLNHTREWESGVKIEQGRSEG